MLTRDSTRRRRVLGLGAGSGWLDISWSSVVVIESERLACKTC
jgi:hypothetical protein